MLWSSSGAVLPGPLGLTGRDEVFRVARRAVTREIPTRSRTPKPTTDDPSCAAPTRRPWRSGVDALGGCLGLGRSGAENVVDLGVRDAGHSESRGLLPSGKVAQAGPGGFALTMKRLELPGERCVFVDDVARCLSAARALGMTTIHATDPVTTVAELQRILGGHPLRPAT
jgi:hypothetical protein